MPIPNIRIRFGANDVHLIDAGNSTDQFTVLDDPETGVCMSIPTGLYEQLAETGEVLIRVGEELPEPAEKPAPKPRTRKRATKR